MKKEGRSTTAEELKNNIGRLKEALKEMMKRESRSSIHCDDAARREK
jgi:hypothetical protein